MEKNLENIIKQSDKALTVKIKKQVAKEKFSADTILGFNGGIFKINPSLITFVNFLISKGKIDNIVLIDNNENPILIDNLESFLTLIVDQYMYATGKYQASYQNLSNE